MKRKSTLEERQRQMRANQQRIRRQQDRRRKIDSERVMTLAAMGVSVHEIARELGCSTDSLYATHREAIEEGRARGGIIITRILWEMAQEGNQTALRYFFWKFNGEIIDPRPIKDPSQRLGRLSPEARMERRLREQIEAEKRARALDEQFRRWFS